jgi:hypothetical protein
MLLPGAEKTEETAPGKRSREADEQNLAVGFDVEKSG